MTLKHFIRDEYMRDEAIATLRTVSLPCRMEIREGSDRSLEQNRTAWMHYGEIAKHHGMTPEEAHRLCKLRYGVPILRRDSEEFEATWTRIAIPLSDADQLRIVGLIDVTSVMTVAQMGEYIDTYYREQSSRGVQLTDPGEPAVMRGNA